MDKLKMLNIFIFAFLISLLVQYWFFPKPNTQIIDQGVVVSVDSDALVVPNIPKITLKNTSTGTINLSTCEHIRITIDSLPLE
jgi:hypothetical protein